MAIYRIYRRQNLAMDLGYAWWFFTSPYYLNQTTPEFFHVEITSSVPKEIYAGLMISYRMKAVWGAPMDWLSEICHCEKPWRFVYQQRVGPFGFWSHEVCLSENESGVLLEDIVFYRMPWGWFGDCLHKLLIGPRLQRIFTTRREYLQKAWGSDCD